MHMKAKLEPLRLCDPLHAITPSPPFRVPNWVISRLGAAGIWLNSFHMNYTGVRNPFIACLTFRATDPGSFGYDGFRLYLFGPIDLSDLLWDRESQM